MTNLNLKIEFFNKGESEIIGSDVTPQKNNMSGNSFSFDNISQGKKIFELSGSDVRDGINLIYKNSYQGIVFDGASDNDGNCGIEFKINGKGMTAIVLNFDAVSNEYATKISINGTQYSNSRISFACIGLGGIDVVAVKIEKWNKPRRHVKITSCSLTFTYSFDKKYIKTVTRNSSITNDFKRPEYGISAQSGKVEMQDRDGYLLELIQNRVMKDGLNFELILNGRTIGKYISANLKYRTVDDIATLDLVDDITNMQNEIFIGIDFPTIPTEVIPLTALEILTAFYPRKFKMDKQTESILGQTVIAFPRMPQKDAYKSLIDFARATSTCIYKNEVGELCIKSF